MGTKPSELTRVQLAFSRRKTAIRLLLVLGILLPAILCFALIERFGVNVPFADDFTLAPFIRAVHDGSFKFGQLIGQHNEHRMVLLRLVALAFAWLAHGNLRAEMMFSFVLVLGTAALFWRLIRVTINT